MVVFLHSDCISCSSLTACTPLHLTRSSHPHPPPQTTNPNPTQQASWVAQASFEPPGLTLAVKKDRAIQTMLTPGSKFAMSMLAEGKYKQAMKVGCLGGWGFGADAICFAGYKGVGVVFDPVLGVQRVAGSAVRAFSSHTHSRIHIHT